jgi:hypothetical protein
VSTNADVAADPHSDVGDAGISMQIPDKITL